MDLKGLQDTIKMLRIENAMLKGEVKKWRESFYSLSDRYLNEETPKRESQGERRPSEIK